MSLRTVRILLWLPLLAFLLMLGLVTSGLIRPHDVTVRSQMIGQPLPRFVLPNVRPGQLPLASGSFADGRVRLVNIFASWCGPCAIEMPILLRIGRSGVPETYVVDGGGVVRFQHIGPIAEQDVPDILAAVRGAR